MESITFTWFVVVTTIVIIIYGYNKYRQLEREISLGIHMFNAKIFMPDRAMFDQYKNKKMLLGNDFIKMYKDDALREHLLKKEVSYYQELLKIVDNLNTLKFYKRLAVIILVGTASIEIFFVWSAFSL